MTGDSVEGRLSHVLRYGTAGDEPNFRGPFKTLYDSIIVSGTTVANSPSSIAAFLSSQAIGKPFIIDPTTHAFQHELKALRSLKTNEVRESVRQLALILGEPVSSALAEGRPVSPRDFSDPRILGRFVEHVIDFQAGLMSTELTKSDDIEYFEFANKNVAIEPEALVAPYFYMEEDTIDDWLPTNLAMAKRAKEQNLREKVLFEVVIGSGLLTSAKVDRLIGGVAELLVDGIALWVEGLDETQASFRTLAAYARLLAAIGQTKPVLILYGSYLPVAMAKLHPEWGITAVCHSLDYGEHRGVTPVGGGFRSSKFYYPRMHARIRYEDAQALAQPYLGSAVGYETGVCGCPVCKTLIRQFGIEKAFEAYGETQLVEVHRRTSVAQRPMQTQRAHHLSAAHYLFCKSSEYAEQPSSPNETATTLNDAYKWARSVIGEQKAGYLRRWAQLIAG